MFSSPGFLHQLREAMNSAAGIPEGYPRFFVAVS